MLQVNHCGHCLRKTSTPIPCYECATVQYCGETCRDLSWEQYHSVECGVLAYLEPSRCLGRLPHLALRCRLLANQTSPARYFFKST